MQNESDSVTAAMAETGSLSTNLVSRHDGTLFRDDTEYEEGHTMGLIGGIEQHLPAPA